MFRTAIEGDRRKHWRYEIQKKNTEEQDIPLSRLTSWKILVILQLLLTHRVSVIQKYKESLLNSCIKSELTAYAF